MVIRSVLRAAALAAFAVSLAQAPVRAAQGGDGIGAENTVRLKAAIAGNHPKGVWTLPPTLRLKDKDRGKYLAIGESDRMTMKFIKPKQGERGR